MALVLKHATLAQLGEAFRERYRSSSREECARLAKWLIARVADGTFTETQVRNFFGLNVSQWNDLKARMQALIAHYDAVQAAQGE
jgi:hypothetical protein